MKSRSWVHYRRTVSLIGLVLVLALSVAYLRLRPIPVEAAPPSVRDVVSSLAVSGRIHGTVEADIQPPRAGIVESVFIRDGDDVRAGDPLVRIRSENERRLLLQAEASTHVAAAHANQVRTGPLASEIGQARAEVRQAIDAARARLSQSRLQLRLLREGARSEEREQADAFLQEIEARVRSTRLEMERQERLHATVDIDRADLDFARAAAATAHAVLAQAMANAEQARADVRRTEELFGKGAVPQANLDRDRTALTTAEAQVRQARAEEERTERERLRQERIHPIQRGTAMEQARESLRAAEEARRSALARYRQTLAGARPQEIARAEAMVREDEAALRGTERSGRERLATLESQPRPEAITVADARLRETRRAESVARERYEEGMVRAPFDGIVAGRVVESGESVGGTGAGSLLRLVGMDAPEIRLDTDEANLGKLRVGQEAVVTADAFPDRAFQARVTRIGAQVDPLRGTVEVRLHPIGTGIPRLRPMQTVDVNLITSRSRRRLVVPPSAVKQEMGRAYVLVARRGRAVKRPVTTGSVATDGVVVLSGLNAHDRIITEGDRVEPGNRVFVRSER